MPHTVLCCSPLLPLLDPTGELQSWRHPPHLGWVGSSANLCGGDLQAVTVELILCSGRSPFLVKCSAHDGCDVVSQVHKRVLSRISNTKASLCVRRPCFSGLIGEWSRPLMPSLHHNIGGRYGHACVLNKALRDSKCFTHMHPNLVALRFIYFKGN